MNKIEVGEYIRTIDGYIRKIDNINTEKRKITIYGEYILDIPYKNSNSVAKKKIVKHSSNIIDLIEVGDIVRVLDNGYNRKIDLRDEDILQSFKEDLVLENWKLKSIVTKEQFKEMEYRVDE